MAGRRKLAIDCEVFKADRRTNRRYPLSLSVQYSTRDGGPLFSGTGRTVDISSSGVCFTTESELAIGRQLRVAIDWPAAMDGVRLQLVTEGRIRRAEPGCAVMLIQSHEFRTRGRDVVQIPRRLER